jgi:polar amino acid transport system substrate-binding protein
MSSTMIKRNMFLFMLVIVLTSMVGFAYAEKFKVAVAQLPTTDTYKALALAIAEAGGNSFDIQVVPNARAAYLIENKQIDTSMPMLSIKDPAKVRALKYDYSTTPFLKSAFVLFTNKAKSVDIADLKKGNTKGFKIEADTSMVNQFEFTALASTNIEASLKKVEAGTIDGFIHSQTSTDAVLKNLKLSKVKRQLYDEFDLVFTLQKGARGGALDKQLTAGLEKIKANGTYERLFGKMAAAAKYNDWQP